MPFLPSPLVKVAVKQERRRKMPRNNTELSQKRYSELFALGMCKNWIGFTFQDIAIDMDVVNELPESEWVETLEQLKISIDSKKRSLDNSAKSDREKLQDFIKSLGQITGPELKDVEHQHILDGSLDLIRCAREFVIESLEKLEADGTANI